MFNTYTTELPSSFDFDSLSKFFEGDNSEKYLNSREIEFYIKSGAENYNTARAQIEMLNRKVEKARTQWACISAKTQRTKKADFNNGVFYELKAFQNLVQLSPKYKRTRPISAGRETGEKVQRFTKRSRQRMLAKAKKMNSEGLQLPYFVTLTYERNMKDFKYAKKDLNAFFQRFRRMGKDFRYFWKMEPQKRGAIHFHLAFFPPKNFFPEKWEKYAKNNELVKNQDIYVEYVRLRVSSAWNEIAEPGYNERMKDLLRLENEGETVNFNYPADKNNNLIVGTNCRAVYNWKMFIGYVGKYMEKEVDENPWENGKTFIKRHEIKTIAGKKCVPVATINRVRYANTDFTDLPIDSMLYENHEERRITGALHTGRWWGFSYNFDFKEIYSGVMNSDNESKKHVKQLANTLNEINHSLTLKQLKGNAERARKTLKGDSLKRRLEHLRNIWEKQKNRYIVNKDKIELGRSLQFQINVKEFNKIRRFSLFQEWKDCPFLVNYYKSE